MQMLRAGVYKQQSPVLFGKGSTEKTGEIAKELGMTKVLLVTDKGIRGVGHDRLIQSRLEEQGITTIVWDGTQGDCPDSAVREAARLAKAEQVDGIIGLGGGSSMDTAKAVAVIAANTEEILEDIPAYLAGEKKYPNRPMELILIPTTAGTGAESTFVCVISDSKLDCKIGLPSSASYAIVDSSLHVNTPAGITAFSGMDAMSHAVEALTEVKNTPHSDLLSYEAIRIISEWLPKACEDIADPEARDQLAYASNIAGISFSESGVHMGHSVAHNLGHLYHVPHGIGCALMLPPVVEFMAKDYPEKVRKIGEAMGMSVENEENIGKKVADEIRGLMKRVNIPSLAQQNITREQALSLVDLSVGEPLCMSYNGAVEREDIETAVSSAYDDYK